MLFDPRPLEAFRAPERVPRRIRSARLELRPFELADAEAFSDLYVSSYPGHLEPWSPPADLPADPIEQHRAAREYVCLAMESWDEGRDHRFAIIDRASARLIGQIGLTGIVRGVSQSCFIGYWVGVAHTGRGIASEAVVLAMGFAFETLCLHRISLWIGVGNAASHRVAEKLGLRREGVAERALFLGRQWHDTVIYAMTLEEWLLRRDELRQRFTPQANDHS